jgi:hypothetical protein
MGLHKLSNDLLLFTLRLLVSKIYNIYKNVCHIPNGFRYLARSILNLVGNIFSSLSHYEQSQQPTDASHRFIRFRHWTITVGGKENIARQISETVRNRTHVHINFFP